jgi:hypothetical protein
MVIFGLGCLIIHNSDTLVSCYSCNTRMFRSKMKPWGTPTRYPAHADIVGDSVCRVTVASRFITHVAGWDADVHKPLAPVAVRAYFGQCQVRAHRPPFDTALFILPMTGVRL